MFLRANLQMEALAGRADVERVEVMEGLSKLFAVDVRIELEDPDFDLEAILGSEAVLRLLGADELEGVRLFHGLVEEAEYLGEAQHRQLYRLVLRPRIQALQHRVRSRIFQDKDVAAIVKAVLLEAGIPAGSVRWNLGRTYPVRTYCVQYRESELDFVLRLFEDEGIFFTFHHEESGHVMEVADGPHSHQPLPGDSDVLAFSNWNEVGGEQVSNLRFTTQMHPDAYSARDWDWKRPSNAIEAGRVQDGARGLETYEYPGGFSNTALGGRRALDRLHALGMSGYVLEGESNSVRARPGATFEVVDAQPGFFNARYLLTEVTWHFVEAGHGKPEGSGEPSTGKSSFVVRFKAIPADLEFRPARVTPRPRIWGRESAVICGPQGEEIHVDEFGRVRAHFYWDREGTLDDKASCWMRVQQLNTTGSMLLPRVGWEVDVGFLDGDPDRPVVLQKLYNQDTMPPYALPAAKTQTSLQSSSSPGGGGTNELRMEDGPGGMEFALHASRDMLTEVGHDLSEHVKLNVKEEIGMDLQTQVGADESLAVAGNQSVTVKGGWTDAVGGARELAVTGLEDWGVKGNFTQTCEADQTETVGGVFNVLANSVDATYAAGFTQNVGGALTLGTARDLRETVGGRKTETVGGARLESITQSKGENISGAKALTAAAIKIKTGSNVAVSTKGPFALSVGGPWVETCGEGFTLSAKVIRVLAAGGLKAVVGGTQLSASGSTLKLKASSLSLKGALSLKLKGKINYEK